LALLNQSNFIYTIVLYTLTIYLAIGVLGYFLSNTLIHHPPKPSTYRDNENIIKIESSKRNKISAIYLHNPNATYSILYSHGNAEDIGVLTPYLLKLREKGFSVLAYDYQGYGTSTGRPSEKNTYADIQATYNYMINTLKIPANKIILFGRSLGSGPSLYLAEKNQIAGIILEGAFVSAFRVLTVLPVYPVDEYRNLKRIKNIKIPMLIIHAKKDEVISFWHGKKLLKHAPFKSRHLWVAGARHNDLFDVGQDAYWNAIVEYSKLLDKN